MILNRKSDVFARTAAGVFAANGVRVSIWPVLMPVPTVSFAARYLHTSAGVMITASHNPSKYNGYKVYGPDGCQITVEAADNILKEIEKLDIFADVRNSDFETGIANGSIQYIQDEVFTAFVEQVKSQSVLFGEEVDKNIAIVYSPLNGSGLKPVTRTLKEMGYTNITVVREQEQSDGRFPTCPYPNPEIKDAMALGIEYAKRCNADLMLATDPDCDRVGIDPAVITDCHRRFLKIFLQIISQPLRSLCYGINIYTVCSGTDHTTQTAGTKSKIPIKSIFHQEHTQVWWTYGFCGEVHTSPTRLLSADVFLPDSYLP